MPGSIGPIWTHQIWARCRSISFLLPQCGIESAQVMATGTVAASIATKDYPYKCMFKNLLSYDKSSSAFQQICSGQGWLLQYYD